MPFVEGYLDERITVGSGRPDQGLPGDQPGIDNTLPGVPGPVDPGYGVPLPPVTIWPTPPRPPHVSGGPVPPTYPVDPDYGLPLPPTVWPTPPKPVGPDQGLPVPIRPSHPIYPPFGPNNDLPLPPGAVWPPLPPELSGGQYMCMVWIVGVGYRWTVIDTNLHPAHPIVPPARPPHVSTGPVPAPGRPTQPIAPTPEPRR
jgi:hypothetical protein